MQNEITKEIMKGYDSYQKPGKPFLKATSKIRKKVDEKKEETKEEQPETKIDISDQEKYLSAKQIKKLPDNLKAGIIKKKKTAEENKA